MTEFDLPFVYDATNDYKSKKMYNRGQIMSNDELHEINEWANKLYADGKLNSMSYGRFELKLHDYDTNVIPLIFDIKKRLECREKLSSFRHETDVKDFLAVIPLNGFIHKHTDPNDFQNNLFHVRFNVFINIPPDNTGNTYYKGVVVDSVKGSYVLCRSGIDEHWSDPNTSNIPRISLSFGYLLPAEKVDELTRDTSFGTYSSYYPLKLQNIGRLSLILNDTGRTIDFEERGEKGSCIYTASNLMTETQCKFLIDYIENNSSVWEERMIAYGNNVECKYIQLNKNKHLSDYDIVDKFIFSIIGNILRKLKEHLPTFDGTQDDGYSLRKIFGLTKLHIDGVHSNAGGFIKFIRCLSLIIVLNDDYDGGVFCFPNQGLKFRVQKGQAVMFPPYWTHPHSATSVGQGQSRYTINTWILEKFID
jgi:hypothetical protein